MADVPTTDLTPTTETPPGETPPSPAPGSEPTSITENPTPTPEGEEAATLLTGAEPKAEEAATVEKTPEELEAEAEHAKLFGAPEGEYEVQGLPEGMEIDKDALAAATPVAKELGLSQEGFNKLVSVYANEIVPKATEAVVESLQRDISAQHAAWATEAVELVKADPVFEGKKLTEVQQIAAKSLDRFGSPELRTFLNDSGLGNNPHMLKFAYMAGALIAEDTTFERGEKTPTKKTVVEKFYGPQE